MSRWQRWLARLGRVIVVIAVIFLAVYLGIYLWSLLMPPLEPVKSRHFSSTARAKLFHPPSAKSSNRRDSGWYVHPWQLQFPFRNEQGWQPIAVVSSCGRS